MSPNMLIFTLLPGLLFRISLFAPTLVSADFMSLDCKIPEVTDAKFDPAKRWAAVQADDAWKAAVDSATKSINDKDTGGLSFPELVSNVVHGPEDMQCDDLAARSGCGDIEQCWNFPAAGFFITNSLVSIANLNYNVWDAITKAQSDVLASVGVFSSTFAVQQNDEQLFYRILANILGLTFAVYVAPLWNIAFRKIPYFADRSNQLGTIKDIVNPMVATSVVMVKDTSLTGASLNAQNELSANVGELVKSWENGINEYNKKLFDGSKESIDLLWAQISDGKVLTGDFGLDEAEAKSQIQKAIYGVLIPRAWAASNKDIHSFILDSGAACGTKDPVDEKYLKPEVGDMIWVCIDDKIYYLLSVSGDTGSCVSPGGGTPYCDKKTFGIPPGGTSLDGKNWGGLSREEVITGALNTFKSNGDANGAAEINIDNADAINDIAENSITTPGIIVIPVCSAEEAYSNWFNKKTDLKNYPCND